MSETDPFIWLDVKEDYENLDRRMKKFIEGYDEAIFEVLEALKDIVQEWMEIMYSYQYYWCYRYACYGRKIICPQKG